MIKFYLFIDAYTGKVSFHLTYEMDWNLIKD